MRTVRIGTRASQLALWQASYVKQALLERYRDLDIELVEMVSEGDRTLDVPLHQSGGKGLFLKELESALSEGHIDLAVHSMKDVTVNLPDGLHIPVMCARDDPRDAWVSNRYPSLDALPRGAVVGTCSLRRRCQIQARYPELVLENLRGNVNTRLARLDAGEFDGIILAVAGLKRLGMKARIAQMIDPDVCLPAVGQGVVGIECRAGDGEINALIRPLGDPDALLRVSTERAANAVLDGGCHAPVAVYGEILEGRRRVLRVRARVGALDGSRILASDRTGPCTPGNDLGRQVAQDLINQGARTIIDSVHVRE